MNIIRSSQIKYLNRFTSWFFHGNLSPNITLSVIFIGFTFSFIHKAYLFLVILNRLPEMFDILKHFG